MRPVIGITMGDAAGIGPEIVIRSLISKEIRTAYRSVIIGDAVHLRSLASKLGADIHFAPFSGSAAADQVEIYDLGNLPSVFERGRDTEITGRASAEYLTAAVDLWRDGKIDAIATAPISKKAIGMGGYNYPGHTEFLAELTDTEEFAMSFFADKLRVVLLSTHLPLTAAIDLVRTERLEKLIRFTDREMRRLLNKDVTIAVAGLNPHASEGGMFGAEEASEIEPAIARCRAEGIDVSGPYSPDTVFLRGLKGEFDVCIALYHDQGTIAVKSLSFGAGVNVTLGLPLIRTSVDHGTAYDIAEKYIADASSMAAAIVLAGELASQSRNAQTF